MGDQTKNLLIGIFVIAALSIVVFVLMFLNPNVGDEGQKIKVRFSNIDKITVGTRVTFGGKPIGEVVGIREIEENINERHPHDGQVYIYELELRIDSHVKVFNTDEVSARTSGLLGEKSVGITPMPQQPGQKLRLVNEEVIYAQEAGSVEETLKEFKELTDKLEMAIDGIIETFQAIKDEKVIEHIGASAKNIRDITRALNNPKSWSETLENVHNLTAKALDSWDKIDELAGNLADASKQIASGEGTIGRLVMRDDLYIRTAALMSKAEVIMNDVNHYGILFHLDKGWQRLRARRLNLLQKLSCPIEFRNYFNDEMDKVVTSLERVQQVVEDAGECGVWTLYDSPSYGKVFSELLRRVSVLDEELQMYNRQIVDQDSRRYEISMDDCYECWR